MMNHSTITMTVALPVIQHTQRWRRNNMLEAIIMTIGTIVFGVIMVFVTLFSVVSILVFYDRYSAKKMGKRRK
jgi:high-affinity nickel permease